jgi:hypothetical protein
VKRHRLDPFSLVFGLAFAGLGGLLLDTDVDAADLAQAGWLPLPLVVFGLFLLAVGVDRARGEPRATEEEEPGPPEDGQA